MRSSLALRRAGALVSAVALLTTAGAATGLLTGVAQAAGVSTISPSAVNNSASGSTSFTLTGSGFSPTSTVALTPVIASLYPKESLSITGSVTPSLSTTSLAFTAPMTNAAPGDYNVNVTTGGTTSTCAACLYVANPGKAAITAVAGNSKGTFTVTGTNLAKGTKLEFLEADGVTVDPAMTWLPGTDSGGTHTTGYTSSTSLKGTYTFTAGAVAGKHYLRATTTDAQKSSPNTTEFWQPTFTTVTPAQLGQGATNIPVTVSGAGIRKGTALLLQEFTSSVNDLTVGTGSVAADSTSVTAPVTVTHAATSDLARNVTLVGPDGGYAFSAAALLIKLAPSIDAQTVGSVGQGGTVSRTITGTGLKPGAVFSSTVTGLSFSTTSVAADGTSAVVAITATKTATVGKVETVTVTNPDHGTYDYTDDGTGTPIALGGQPQLLSVNAAPQITRLTPSAVTAGSSTVIGISGTGFDTNGMTATFGPGISAGPVTVSSATAASVSVTTAADAAGPHDVVLKNTADQGTSTCTACFGIDALSVSPSSAANTQTAFDVTITRTGTTDLSGATAVTLSKKVATADQPDITAVINGTPTTTTIAATLNLTNAAPGYYNVIVSKPSGAVSCSGCFRVTGQAITVTAISPNKGGAGATDFPVTITGTGFSHGETVTIAGVTVSAPTFVSPTTLTATVTIPANATPAAAVNVVVKNADADNGGFTGTFTGGYAIVAAPTVTSTSTATPDHKSLGQGATSQVLTINGTGFTAGGSSVSFSGTGITPGTVTFVSATQLTVPVSIDAAAPIGDRTVTVIQTDNGGRSAAYTAITVTAKPAPSLIAPSSLVAGKATPVTLSGQGFQSGSTIQVASVDFANVVLNADGTLSATATAAADATPGLRSVAVFNPDGGKGPCACSLTIQVPTALSFTQSVASSTAGNPDTLAGVLTNANTGAGLPGLSVSIHVVPTVGPPSTPTTPTNGSGGYLLTAHPAYTTTFTAYFVGDATHAAATAASRTVTEAARVTISSPGNGAASKATTTLVVKGIVQPNKAGHTVSLYTLKNGTFHGVASSKVASNGSYAISVKLAKGSYTIRTGIGATTGNTAGYSPTVGVKRT